jgi:sugar lactone lactonase YvrE
LFAILPEYIVTPDGMAIHPSGELILSCPNYADDAISGVVARLDTHGVTRKWFDVPRHPQTGIARNMGIALADDGWLFLCDNQGWSGAPELQFKGRLLAVKADEDGQILDEYTVAWDMEHPNGVRLKDGYLYVTQSCLSRVADPSGLLVSAVYRFQVGQRDLHVSNTLDDPEIIATFITRNPDVQYGADGIVFGPDGALYVGNFGDGEVYRIEFDAAGRVITNRPWARDPDQLRSTDGMIFDEAGNLYVADFSANAIAQITPDGTVRRYAESPDSDGLNGELNQPGEPIVFDGRLIASCFDLVTGPDKVDTGHSLPATLSQLPLPA